MVSVIPERKEKQVEGIKENRRQKTLGVQSYWYNYLYTATTCLIEKVMLVLGVDLSS